MTLPIILAIDDEPAMLRLLRLGLTSFGFEIVAASSGDEGLELFDRVAPDIVLLDIRMPGTPALDILRTIKSRGSVPVVILSARSEEDARIEAFNAGADEFVAKPFVLEQLASNISYLLAKVQGEDVPSFILHCGVDIEIDLRRQRVTRTGEPLRLTRSEWLLLEELARTPGEARLHQEILTKVWGVSYKDDTDFLRTVVDRFSAKLGDDPEHPTVIVPFLKIGYTLNCRVV